VQGSSTHDCYLVKFNALGRRLWGTYYGGDASEYCFAISADIDDNIIMAGRTHSSNNIATNGTFKDTIDKDFSGYVTDDSFVAKFTKDGKRIWGTYYGGEFDESFYGLTTDNSGNIIACGSTRSLLNIGSANSYMPDYPHFSSAFFCAFFVKFDSTGNRIWSSYYGDACSSQFYDVETDIDNNIYLTGRTLCLSGIATPGSYQDSCGGITSNVYDAMLVKFNSNGNRLWGTYFGGLEDDQGLCLHIDKQQNIYMGGVTESENNIGYNGFRNTFCRSNNIKCYI
jgi:hypothetical protein